MTVIDFLKQNWGWIIGPGLALLIVLLASLVNACRDPDHNPETPPPRWVQVLMGVIDFLSFIQKGGGSYPGKMTPDKPKDPEKGAADPLLLGFLGALALLLVIGWLAGGCAGFKAPTYAGLTVGVRSATDVRAQLPPRCKQAATDAAKKAATDDDAHKAVDTVYDRCDATLKSLDAGVLVCKTARDGVHDGTEGAWLQMALNAYENAKKMAERFGFKMPVMEVK